MRRLSRGFASVLLLVFIGLLIIDGGAYLVLRANSSSPPITTASTTAQSRQTAPTTEPSQ